MKMPNNPAKFEVLIKQYFRSILDMTVLTMQVSFFVQSYIEFKIRVVLEMVDVVVFVLIARWRTESGRQKLLILTTCLKPC